MAGNDEEEVDKLPVTLLADEHATGRATWTLATPSVEELPDRWQSLFVRDLAALDALGAAILAVNARDQDGTIDLEDLQPRGHEGGHAGFFAIELPARWVLIYYHLERQPTRY